MVRREASGHRDTPVSSPPPCPLHPTTLRGLAFEVLRSCGIHGAHHEQSPPAEDESPQGCSTAGDHGGHQAIFPPQAFRSQRI